MHKDFRQDLNLEDFLQQFQQITDFKIARGERQYGSTWLTGGRKISKKWLALQEMRPYLKEILDYQEKNQNKIRDIECQWNQWLHQGKVTQRLQTLNTGRLKKMFKSQEQPIYEQKDDSEYAIKKQKAHKIPKQPKIKKKTKPKIQRSRPKDKLLKKKQVKSFIKRKKVRKNEKVDKPKIEQSTVKDEIQVALKSFFEERHNTFIHAPVQSQKTAKISLDFTNLIPQINKQPIAEADIEKADQDDNKSILNEASGDQISQPISPLVGLSRAVLTEQSQYDSQGEEEQFQYESQPLSEVIDHKQIKEFIEVKLKQIQQNEQVEAHLQQNDHNSEVKQQQQDQAYKEQQDFHNLRQSSVSLREVICDDFEHKIEQLKNVRNYELPQGFTKFIASKMLSEQDLKQGGVRVNNIISLYNLKNFCYFSVNIGNNYYEEQRFVEYHVLKQRCMPILLKWLKVEK